MDPVTGAVIIAGLKYAGKPTVDVIGRLVERLLGPIADTGGDALDEWVRRRHKRAEAVLTDSVKMLRTAQLEPQPVPGRILFPLMQYASLEEDDDLRAKWTALLANASSPGPENQILPAYAEILRQLTPIQAKILDHMFQQTLTFEPGAGEEPMFLPSVQQEIMDRFGLSREKYTLFASDFHRMNLIEVRRLSFKEVGMPTEELYGTLRLTALSLGFLRATTPPAVSSENS